MLTNTYPPIVGGVSTAVVRSATGLRKLGHQVLVIAPNVAGQKADPWVVRVPALPVFNSPFFAPLASNGIHQLLRRFQPHVIHVHHPWLAGATGRISARSAHVPLIFTYHTMYEAFAHVVGRGDEQQIGQKAVAAADAFVHAVDVVIAPSRSTAALLVKRGHPATKIRICPGGVDTSMRSAAQRDASRRRLGLRPDQFVFGHLGRLSDEKNLGVLSTSIAGALRRLPTARCVVAGDGNARAEMTQTFSDAGVGDRVVFLGSVQGEAVTDAYSVMDLFVFTSLNDTQGLVLIEAMAAGMPVVAIRAPGARDVIDGQNGELTKATASAVESALVRWATDVALLRTGQAAARRTGAANSVEAAAKNLEAVYFDSIESRGL